MERYDADDLNTEYMDDGLDWYGDDDLDDDDDDDRTPHVENAEDTKNRKRRQYFEIMLKNAIEEEFEDEVTIIKEILKGTPKINKLRATISTTSFISTFSS